MNKKFIVRYTDDNRQRHYTIIQGCSTLKFYLERFDEVVYEICNESKIKFAEDITKEILLNRNKEQKDCFVNGEAFEKYLLTNSLIN